MIFNRIPGNRNFKNKSIVQIIKMGDQKEHVNLSLLDIMHLYQSSHSNVIKFHHRLNMAYQTIQFEIHRSMWGNYKDNKNKSKSLFNFSNNRLLKWAYIPKMKNNLIVIILKNGEKLFLWVGSLDILKCSVSTFFKERLQ